MPSYPSSPRNSTESRRTSGYASARRRPNFARSTLPRTPRQSGFDWAFSMAVCSADRIVVRGTAGGRSSVRPSYGFPRFPRHTPIETAQITALPIREHVPFAGFHAAYSCGLQPNVRISTAMFRRRDQPSHADEARQARPHRRPQRRIPGPPERAAGRVPRRYLHRDARPAS